MVNGGAFIFHMCIPCGQTFSFVPWSRSSAKVKVKYQNHIFQKMAGGGGALVFHEHFLLHSLLIQFSSMFVELSPCNSVSNIQDY